MNFGFEIKEQEDQQNLTTNKDLYELGVDQTQKLNN